MLEVLPTEYRSTPRVQEALARFQAAIGPADWSSAYNLVDVAENILMDNADIEEGDILAISRHAQSLRALINHVTCAATNHRAVAAEVQESVQESLANTLTEEGWQVNTCS